MHLKHTCLPISPPEHRQNGAYYTILRPNGQGGMEKFSKKFISLSFTAINLILSKFLSRKYCTLRHGVKRRLAVDGRSGPPIASTTRTRPCNRLELSMEITGAGDGNRTHVRSLGSSYSAIELRPQKNHLPHCGTWWRRERDSNPRYPCGYA